MHLPRAKSVTTGVQITLNKIDDTVLAGRTESIKYFAVIDNQTFSHLERL